MTRRGSTAVRRVQRGSNGRAVRSAETIERDARAWELRVEHLTYQQIGDQLGITKEGARQAVERH
jgi:DNA-binding CsgD family transcriptional regulator